MRIQIGNVRALWLLLASFGFLVLGILLMNSAESHQTFLESHGIHAQGRVLSISCDENERSICLPHAAVTFVDRAGQPVDDTVYIPEYSSLRPGATVSVEYSPSDPHVVQAVASSEEGYRWMAMAISVIVFCALLISAAIEAFRER